MAIFNGIEDIRGQKLNPTKLRQQGNMMIPNYDYQNATYGLITKRVASLCEESKLKGAALEGFKYQMIATTFWMLGMRFNVDGIFTSIRDEWKMIKRI